MRRRVRKSCGVSPKTRAKSRWKWNGERHASRAARSSVIGSQKDAAIRSRARQSRRNVTSSTRGIKSSVSNPGHTRAWRPALQDRRLVQQMAVGESINREQGAVDQIRVAFEDEVGGDAARGGRVHHTVTAETV